LYSCKDWLPVTRMTRSLRLRCDTPIRKCYCFLSPLSFARRLTEKLEAQSVSLSTRTYVVFTVCLSENIVLKLCW